MRKHNLNTLGIYCFIIMISIGCKKFVDLKSPTVLNSSDFFSNESEISTAVTGMYSGLRSYYSSFYNVGELPSDNTQANGYTLSSLPMDQLLWQVNESSISNTWRSAYSVIARANIILDRMNDVMDISENTKTQFEGEAKFIRALMYFNLVQFFGHIPLVVHEIKTEEESYQHKQVSKEDVYNQIETDLKDAIGSLTEESVELGRVSKEAAQSLLGKVYITNGQFAEAIPVLKEVINSNKFDLLDDYERIFNVENEDNEEIIFSIQYKGNSGFGEGSPFSVAFPPFGSTDITSGGQPAGAMEGTLDLFNAFEDNDSRKDASIRLFSTSGVYYTRKYLDKPMASNEGENNWIILRYSDVLLLYSEALNEANIEGTGSYAESEIVASLNEVRDRANLETISGLTSESLRDTIQHERRVELCFEGHRWFDLLRTGTMLSTMSAYKDKYSNGGGYRVDEYEVTPNKVLFPIPFNEISLNPEMEQNDY